MGSELRAMRRRGADGGRARGLPWAATLLLACLSAPAAVSSGCVQGPLAPDGCLDDDPDTPCDDDETGLVGDPDDRRQATGDCELAPVVVAGRYPGTLFGADDEQGGACGQGGPDAFVVFDAGFRLDLEATVEADNFVPRVEVRFNGCPGGETLACGLNGEGATLRDLPAGSEALVVVGIDPAAPELEGATRESLAFDLFLAVTPVLGGGSVCEPPELGRCEAGTSCQSDLDPEQPARCRSVAGDVCGSGALEVSVEPTMDGTATATLDVDASIADDHVHGCGGDGEVDLVVELSLSPQLAVDEDLVIEAQGVGLAVRSPWCDPQAELDCAAADGGTASVRIDDVGARAQAGERPILFIDWPVGDTVPDQLTLDLSLVTG